MRKALIIVSIILTAAAPAAAQFKFGITGGVNFFRLERETSADEGFDKKVGSKLGLTAEYAFGQAFALSTELVVAQKGYRYHSESMAQDGLHKYSERANINYLQIPLNALFRFHLNENWRVYPFAGPYFGYVFSQIYSNELYVYDAAGRMLHDSSGDTSQYKKGEPYDFGVNAGVGIEYRLFFFKAFYETDLTNHFFGSGSRLHNFGLSVGCLFDKF